MEETPSFHARTGPKATTWGLIASHPRESLTVIGLTAGGTLAYYTYTTYIQKFLVNTSGFSKDQANLITAGGLTGARDMGAAFLLVTASLLVVACYSSVNAVVKAELFPTATRALGVALPYSLANAAFGGTAEYVALAFKQAGRETGFFTYVTVIIGGSLLVYLAMRDTRRHSRIAED
jgi:MHS family alpha-ketoglutarate permease-like MFS transporter